MFAHGAVVFVELKAPGKARPGCRRRSSNGCSKIGHKVSVLDSKEAVDRFLACDRGGCCNVRFEPHEYQRYVIQRIINEPAFGVFFSIWV